MKGTLRVGFIAILLLALWPAIVSAAAPPPPKGKLVYEDDFSDAKKSGLEDNLKATDYSRGFHAPGVYHLKSVKAGETHWSLFPSQNYGDFTVEMEVWDNSDAFTGDISQGVVFRAKDNTHFYAVLVDPRKGQYSVRKQDGDKASDLIAAKASKLVKKQSDVNLLRIDAAGDKFTIYLNGETLDSFSDATYAKGALGMITSNIDAADPHMHFDNIKIYSTESAPPATTTQPATLPSTGQAENLAGLMLAVFALTLLGAGMWVRRYR